jgi:hypothetical protein
MKWWMHLFFVPISDTEGAMNTGAGLVFMDDGTMRIFLDDLGGTDDRGIIKSLRA